MADGKIKKIVVDRNICIGAGPCVFAAGSVFELDAERKAVLKLAGGAKNSGPADKSALEDAAITDEALIAAAQSCPVRAVTFLDEAGKPIEY